MGGCHQRSGWRRGAAAPCRWSRRRGARRPEHERVDHQPQLVDEILLDQRAHELETGGYDDLPVQPLLQLRHRVHRVALHDRGVVPTGIFEGRGHDVLGDAVHPVRQLAGPGWPPRGRRTRSSADRASRASARCASSSATLYHPSRSLPPTSTNQPPCLKPSSPVGVLDDSVQRDVLRSAHHDRCHCASPLDGGVGYHRCRRRGTGKLGARRPPSSPPGRRLYKMEVRQGAGRR